MDQARDELLYSSVKGKNPFKDVRVRKALYQAIDIETIRSRLMRGQSLPTGGITPSPVGAYNDPELEKRLPFDLNAARQQMTDAGYPQGFEVTLDCPNNRYINDEEICDAGGILAVGVKVRVRCRSPIPEAQRLDLVYLLGGGASPARDSADPLLPAGARHRGLELGQFSDARLVARLRSSRRATKREQLIKAALQQKDPGALPAAAPSVVPWGARQNVDLVHRADNWVEFSWIRMR
jgi:peptide/nickel transport system substrate-binding protein